MYLEIPLRRQMIGSFLFPSYRLICRWLTVQHVRANVGKHNCAMLSTLTGQQMIVFSSILQCTYTIIHRNGPIYFFGNIGREIARKFMRGSREGGGDRGSEPPPPPGRLRHHRSTSETPFQWRFASGSMVAHLEYL